MTNLPESDIGKEQESLVLENHKLKDLVSSSNKKISELESRISQLQKRIDEITEKHTQTIEELGIAKLIVEQSPNILFRRKAVTVDEKPKLEYVSENLARFGYEPKDFIDEKIRFPDIVHPDDVERLRDEIRGYTDRDVEEYTQFYRLITKDGEIRWVEDQTSVVREEKGQRIHNQGILIDITDKKIAIGVIDHHV